MVTKKKYIDLMEKALSAYTDEHIKKYFDEVKTDGLKEHGFPRLTVSMGILIAHGNRTYLRPLFLEMMEFCCKTIPTVKAANEFSVREIITAILEFEKLGAFDKEDIERWKRHLATIEPYSCYKVIAKAPTDNVYNWALFTGVSEYMRQYIGLADTEEFVDVQIASQLAHLDENLMYKDAPRFPPMVYDLVSRLLFSLLLHFGYKGKYFEQIDTCLKNAGLLTLKMQSVTGEIPFGGRSNQFILNEGLYATLFEFEANRYAKEGNMALAAKFKARIKEVIAASEYWFSKEPIYHVKNRFPLETRYGCEDYGYFDKYMITTASWFFTAYMMCNEDVPEVEFEEKAEIFMTSDEFNKLFVRGKEYALQFELNANLAYDASGLGRVHRRGAPSPICLSLPCGDASKLHYFTNIEGSLPVSLCAGIIKDGVPKFATDAQYNVDSYSVDGDNALVSLTNTFEDGTRVNSSYKVTNDGVEISVCGDGKIAFALPAFSFDGETYTKTSHNGNTLTVAYEGWVCKYTADCAIKSLDATAYNRNGYYSVFYAEAKNNLNVKIEIIKE